MKGWEIPAESAGGTPENSPPLPVAGLVVRLGPRAVGTVELAWPIFSRP